MPQHLSAIPYEILRVGNVSLFCQVNMKLMIPYMQGSLLSGGAESAAAALGGGGSLLVPPFSYSDIAGAGLAKFLDNITPEEAASLVSEFVKQWMILF